MKEVRNTEQIINIDTNRHIEGYAIVFESESVDLGGFTEIIQRNALDGVIENSDILCLLDHKMERGVLARSKYGVGSLKLEIDSHGLKYSFDAPNTELGNELIEGIRRGDISASSFGFICEEDEWERRSDNSIIRYIKKIKQLIDVSPVYHPAYESTEVKVDKRGLNELLNSDSDMTNEEIKKEDNEEVNEVENVSESDLENDTNDTEKSEEEEKENTEKDPETSNDDNTTEEVEEDRNNNFINKNNNHNIMKKNFSLIGAIRSVVNENGRFDEVAEQVIKEGRNAANRAGVNTDGQIVLALETRAEGDTVVPNGIMATGATFGNEAVPTDTFDIVGALRDRMVLAEAGAQMVSLSGNVDIPVYSGANCTWENEIGEAKDGSGKFKTVKLTPKRLTATLPISKQFIIQTSESAEALLRQDLINCVAEKLQKTILGDGEGSATEPAGLFAGTTKDTAAFTYNDAVDMEAELESANVNGDYKYILSPTAKAKLRTTNVDKGSGKFVFDNNEVLGIDAFSTNSVVSKGVVLGDWKELIIGSFGSLDIVVDPYTAASKGQIILTVNAYFDYVARRPEAFVKRILA